MNNIKKYLENKKINESTIELASDHDISKNIILDILENKSVLKQILNDINKYLEKSGVLSGPQMENEITSSIWNYAEKSQKGITSTEDWQDAYTDYIFEFVSNISIGINKYLPKIVIDAANKTSKIIKQY